MNSPFQIRTTQNGKLHEIYVGKKTTVWFSYEKLVAIAVSGWGTFKLSNDGETATTRKHLNTIPGQELSAREFADRVAILAYAMDDEITRAIDRPNWTADESIEKDGDAIRSRTGWGF